MTEDEREQQILDQHSDFARTLAGLFKEMSETVADQSHGADVILRALSGDKSARFAAIRFAASRLGAYATRLLILSAAENGHSTLKLIVRPRTPNEFPDGGVRNRLLARTFRTEQIGCAVYGLIKRGMPKADAIRHVQISLRLNLSDRSMERELASFRSLVRKRGYIGDPMAMRFGSETARLRLSDVPRRGRPKNRPAAEERMDDFPAFRISQKGTKLPPIEAG